MPNATLCYATKNAWKALFTNYKGK